MRTLHAWIEDRRIGSFTEVPQDNGGSLFAFEYNEVTDRDIVSLTMVPIEGDRRFETNTFPPPFDMVLPEGERRQRIEEARKILRTDSFSLLGYVGGNPVNRVRFLLVDERPKDEPPELPAPAEIARSTHGKELFRDLAAALDLRQGIAGVQPKLLGAPPAKLSPDLRGFRGSTHILKASTSRFPFLAVNESVCLQVFAAAGLAVPNTTLSADGELLLVDRFDIEPDGRVLGFEEAAALMGETAATKYQRDYGSMIEQLAEVVSPDVNAKIRADLVKALVLNHLLGNGDAHLKNFGVLYRDSRQVSLSPLYDCVSTLPYIPDDIPALALSYEWYSKAWWPREKIEEFAVGYGWLKPIEVTRMVEECREAVLQGAVLIAEYGEQIAGFTGLAERIGALWKERVRAFGTEASSFRQAGRRKQREH
jgi:serine/threonine-protein kinase HipA